MRTIERLENAKRNEVNHTLYWAYKDSQQAGTEDLNFGDVIWEQDIQAIVDFCKEEKIDQITISSTFSSLTTVLWELEQLGCKMSGMKKVPMRYNKLGTNERDTAVAIIVKMA